MIETHNILYHRIERCLTGKVLYARIVNGLTFEASQVGAVTSTHILTRESSYPHDKKSY